MPWAQYKSDGTYGSLSQHTQVIHTIMVIVICSSPFMFVCWHAGYGSHHARNGHCWFGKDHHHTLRGAHTVCIWYVLFLLMLWSSYNSNLVPGGKLSITKRYRKYIFMSVTFYLTTGYFSLFNWSPGWMSCGHHNDNKSVLSIVPLHYLTVSAKSFIQISEEV